MIIDKVCIHCGKPFRVKHTEAGKYCSKDCYRAYEAVHGRPNDTVPVTFACKTCGTDFQRNPGELRQYVKTFGHNPMYCSIPCSSIGRKADADAEWDHKCVICGTEIPVGRGVDGRMIRPRKFCSAACKGTSRSAGYHTKHPNKQMPRRVTKTGYINLRLPYANGRMGKEVLEHRYVMEQHLGRALFPHETVHHRDGNRQNNDISNLELFTSRHGPGARVIDQIEFAMELLRTYPELAKEKGFKLNDG